MSELPQVGQTYKHKTHGDVKVTGVHKRGRGYFVNYLAATQFENSSSPLIELKRDRLKDWQKAVS